MVSRIPIVAAATSLIALTGCLNGGTVSVSVPTGPSSFAEVNTAVSDLTSSISGSSATDGGDLPASSTATYDGFARINTAVESVAGDFTATVDFGADTIDTVIDEVFLEDDTLMSGEITGSGTLNRASFPTVNMPMSGELTGGGTTYDFTGNGIGAFIGPTGEFLVLDLTGSRTINGGAAESTTGGSTAIAER